MASDNTQATSGNSPNVSAGSDGYGNFISNGQATVSLWGSVLEAGQRTADALNASRQEKWRIKQRESSLKTLLGPWYHLLVNEGNVVRMPVIDHSAFVAYMERCDGHFNVSITADLEPYEEGTAAWVVFLRALGIGPTTFGVSEKDLVISDKPLASLLSNAQELTLEMQGETLCHILNLYSLAKQEVPRGRLSLADHENSKIFESSFGTFTLEHTVGTTNVKFRFADRNAINRPKTPFGPPGELMEKGTSILAYYYSALWGQNGCSSSSLEWIDPALGISARLAKLGENLDSILSWRFPCSLRYGHVIKRGSKIRHKSPLLLTLNWLKQAQRIKARALTGDGSDHSFESRVKDSYRRVLMDNPYTEKNVNSYITFPFRTSVSYRGFDFATLPNSPMVSPNRTKQACFAFIEQVLKGFSSCEETSREFELFKAKSSLMSLFESCWTCNFDYNSVRVLPFDPESPLWSQKFVYLS